MAIAKKPSRKQKSEELTEIIINKGGSSPNNNSSNSKNENIKVTIRLSEKVLNIIDEYLERSISNKTRTSWVREAVEEKISRDITRDGRE
jgi:hypothetical protein